MNNKKDGNVWDLMWYEFLPGIYIYRSSLLILQPVNTRWMITVDTRGQLCPAPLIAAKKALKEAPEGEFFIILTDNITSFNNLKKFLNDNKAEFEIEEGAGEWKITVRKSGSFLVEKKPEDYCKSEVVHFEKGDFVIAISSDRMGEGDEELGKLLIGNFLKAIKDLDKLPQKIIFYNSGVKLAVKDSAYVDHLRQLEKMGVEILLCATCINHYKIEGKTGAGELSNMYTIAESMAKASKVIKP